MSLFFIHSYTRSFFLLSWMLHVKLNLNMLVFLGGQEVVDWSDCKFFLVQHLVFLYRAPGRHWSVEAYHAPCGNTRAWALEETLFRVCELKRWHNRCAITHICANALTACFPPLTLCAFCLFHWVITLCLQRRNNVVVVGLSPAFHFSNDLGGVLLCLFYKSATLAA